MHEFSVATSIVESVLKFAQTHRASEVLRVWIAVGEMTCIEPEQLRFSYEALIAGTPLAGSTLEIEKRAAVVECSHCQYHGPPKYWDEPLLSVALPTLQCPECGRATELVEGRDCAIKSVQFVAPAS